MRTRVVLSLLVLAACTSQTPAAPTAPEPADVAEPTPAVSGPVIDASGLDTSAEAVGPIRQGMTAEAVVEALGDPDAKPEYTFMGATGEFVADWSWASKGLTLSMAATDEVGTHPTVSGISCEASCAFDLPWGLKIGSTRAEVEAVYGDHFDPDFTDARQFVAGSIYGGTFYRFEDGKVVGIFIGAGAE